MRRRATILLTLMWLSTWMVFTPAARATATAAILKSVTLSTSPTGTELVLCVDGTYSYKTVQASASTLFIDLAGTKVDGALGSQRWANPAFAGYNLLPYWDASGQWGTRVQVDTKQAQPFVVQKDGSRLRLLYGKSLRAGAAATHAPILLPDGITGRLKPPEWPVDFKVAALLPTTKLVDSRPAVVSPPASESEQSVKSDGQNILPMIDGSRQVVAAPLPAIPSTATPDGLRAGHAAQILVPEKDNSAGMAQGLPAANPMPAVESKPTYTGEPISLNLKDVDLKDFFRLIHEISGLNIILDPDISGSVTLVLDSVPWDQALDIVLKNERLGKVMEDNVLRIAKIETLTSEQEGQMRLASARMDAAPLVTVFRPINYAKATEIATVLKTWVGGGALSRRGTVLVDTRGNTLIISDVQTQIPTVMDIISKMDRKAKQVSIEARVVLANADFSRVLSAALLGGFKNNSTVATSTTGATNGSITIPVPTVSQPFPITTATSATASGFGVASIVNVGANYFINAAISAAEERDQAKTISRPSIVTQNNVQGMVQQGVQVPIQTTINNTVSVQYFNATLQLQVTPQVTDDDHIFLIINVQNNSVGASISGVGPEIATQQATTQVLVPDGGTVIFGGITVTTRSKAATYIPLLGNIPLLGHLFKSSNVSDEDQELLFFVSPKLLIT